MAARGAPTLLERCSLKLNGPSQIISHLPSLQFAATDLKYLPYLTTDIDFGVDNSPKYVFAVCPTTKDA